MDVADWQSGAISISPRRGLDGSFAREAVAFVSGKG